MPATLAVNLEALEAKFQLSQRNKTAQHDARKLVRELDRCSDDGLDAFLQPDEHPGQRQHLRAIAFVGMADQAIDVRRSQVDPVINLGADRLIGYERQQLVGIWNPALGLTWVQPDSDEARDHGARPMTVLTPVSTDLQDERAALRRLVLDRHAFGPTDIWHVYARIKGVKRVKSVQRGMIVVGKLGTLRHYWPDSMTRRRLDRAGVDVSTLGNPLQIRRIDVRELLGIQDLVRLPRR